MSDPLLFMKIRESSMNNTFGWVRKDINGASKNHQGWDLEAMVGTYVIAIADGTIAWTKHLDGSYGNQILLKFTRSSGSPLTLYAFYGHLESVIVSQGQQVKEGQVLGTTGQTGNAANVTPHLHFEIRETGARYPGLGLNHRINPQDVLGLPPMIGRWLPGKWGIDGCYQVFGKENLFN